MKILDAFQNVGEPPPLVRGDAVSRIYSSAREKQISVIPLVSQDNCSQPFYLHTLFRGKVGKNYRYRQKNLPVLGIEYVREGSLVVRQENRFFLIEPGEVFLIQPKMDSEIMTGPERYCIKDSVSVRGELLDAFLVSSGLDNMACLGDFDWGMLEKLMDRIQELGLKDGSDDSIIANSLLAYELLECLAFSRRKVEASSKLANLMGFMRQNMAQPLSLQNLAKQYGCSTSTLLQVFRSVYGKTPHTKLIELRMEQAAKLLCVLPLLSIKEIADRTGYSNSMNFSTAFRRWYGMSPRQYRKQTFNGSC